jgi:hypothetical protein
MTSTPVRRPILCLLLAVGAWIGTVPNAVAKRSTQCTVRTDADGHTSITEVTAYVGAGSKRLTVVVTTSALLGGNASVTMSASLGKKSVLQSMFAQSGGSTHSTVELGVGFRGVHHVDLTTTDGTHFQGQIDGRAVTVTATGGNADSLVFADGAPPPKLRTKRLVTRPLAKLKKAVQGISCPAQSSVTITRALFDDCDRCKLGCDFDPTKAGSLLCAVNIFGSAVACGAGAVETPLALLCIATFEINGLSCTTNAINCEDKCLQSDACCKVHCPGAVGLCCNGDGELCCGKNGPNGGSCCTDCCANNPDDSGGVCCGVSSISGEKQNCVDKNLGLCCEADGTICGGNDCCPPGWTCCNDHYCAPPGHDCCSDPNTPSSTPNFFCGVGDHCADPKTNLCCPADSGPECGGGTTCCNGAQVCGTDQTCCTLLDLCNGACCPSHNCLNGVVCCDAPNHACGSNCCPPFDSCCNGQCCAGSCTNNGSTCCPRDSSGGSSRTCGDNCCAAGSACIDPVRGICQQCPGGVGEGCPPNSGSPVCCPSSSECCSDGTCCTEGQTCCGNPGEQPHCQPSFQCIH